jgi:hypothetical protein
MRTNIILTIAFASVICLSFVGSARCDGTVISVSPSSYTLPQSQIGTNFQISINISGVANLWSWKVRLNWNPNILNVTSGPTEGTFMGGGTLFLTSPTNYTAGYVGEISDTFLSNTSVSGNGVLATVTFQVLAAGQSNITLNETELLQPEAGHPQITHTVNNGQLNVIPEFPSGAFLAIAFAVTTISAAFLAKKRLKPTRQYN